MLISSYFATQGCARCYKMKSWPPKVLVNLSFSWSTGFQQSHWQQSARGRLSGGRLRSISAKDWKLPTPDLQSSWHFGWPCANHALRPLQPANCQSLARVYQPQRPTVPSDLPPVHQCSTRGLRKTGTVRFCNQSESAHFRASSCTPSMPLRNSPSVSTLK